MSKKVYVVMADVISTQEGYAIGHHVISPLHTFTEREDAVEFIRTYDEFVTYTYLRFGLLSIFDYISSEEKKLKNISFDFFEPVYECRTVSGDGTSYNLYIVEAEQN